MKRFLAFLPCLVLGCSTSQTVRTPVAVDKLLSLSVIPAKVGANIVVSDSSTAYRPMVVVENSQMADRLAWSLSTQLESSLRQNGFTARILEDKELSMQIASIQKAFVKVVDRVQEGKVRDEFVRDATLSEAASKLAERLEVDAIAVGMMTAQVKSTEAWKQNFVDATIQAVVTGTATVFTRSNTQMHLAVVHSDGRILWYRSRTTTTLFKDGTTAGAVRKGVEQTFSSFLEAYAGE
jgi:hypothetical protein